MHSNANQDWTRYQGGWMTRLTTREIGDSQGRRGCRSALKRWQKRNLKTLLREEEYREAKEERRGARWEARQERWLQERLGWLLQEERLLEEELRRVRERILRVTEEMCEHAYL